MPLEERKSMSSMTNVIQNIVLENREKLNITGVLDVLSFDDQIVILETELGLLTVKGENLRINKLSLDTTEVIVEGTIFNLSYSEKGCPYDNAPMESFNAIIKKELINHVIYNTFEDAKISIFNFIEKWYNRERIHGSIYNMTPIEFEQNELYTF